jgi:predicted PhzF superfamily epimerase YddE/YHI9
MVDTFGDGALGGTPSAVFFVDALGDDDLLQSVAMEINAPETIFIRSIRDDKYEARCFSPHRSGMYFGNSIFAAAYVILSQTLAVEKITITCEDIDYEARARDSNVTVRFASSQLEKVSTPVNLSSALGGVIVVSIAKYGSGLIVEVRSPSKLANLLVNVDALGSMEYDSFIVTTDAHYNNGCTDYDFCANVYAPKLGVYREIMTPVANAALAEYWNARTLKNEMVAVQMSPTKCGRTIVEFNQSGAYVTGNCAVVMKGEMLINSSPVSYRSNTPKISAGC